MHDCGYQPRTIWMYISKVEHFGMWLKYNDIKVSSVNKDTIKSFLNGHLSNCHCDLRCSSCRTRTALNCLLRVLPHQNQKPITPVEKEIPLFSEMERAKLKHKEQIEIIKKSSLLPRDIKKDVIEKLKKTPTIILPKVPF